MKLIPEEFLTIKDKLTAKLKETETGCLEWTGAKFTGGYGMIHGSKKNGKKHQVFRTNRVFYFLETGVQPGELKVCHRCDHPPCCNIEHLFLGTYADNNLDRDLKGRRKARIPFELLTPESKKLFELAKLEHKNTDFSVAEIAARIKVKPLTLFRAFKRNGVQLKGRKIDPKAVYEIRKLRSEGMPIKDIAAMFNVKAWTIYRTYTGERWGHIRTPYDPPNFRGE